jgi:hypothetical protein
MENSNTPKRGNGHLIAGFVVLLVGFLFLLKNFNILSPELNYYIFSWKNAADRYRSSQSRFYKKQCCRNNFNCHWNILLAARLVRPVI